MSTVMVSVAEAGRSLSKLVLAAQEGQSVIITKRGVPAARLLTASTKRAETTNGRQASAVLAKRLARRRHWATSEEIETTIAEAKDGWEH